MNASFNTWEMQMHACVPTIPHTSVWLEFIDFRHADADKASDFVLMCFRSIGDINAVIGALEELKSEIEKDQRRQDENETTSL